jgi:anti-sigma B factor antagonist
VDPNVDIPLVERPNARILVVHGELDLSTAPTLEAELSAATAAEGPTVVVDLDRVTFMDSTGLQVLLKYLLRLPEGRLRVTKGSPEVQLLFEVSGVGEQLEFWDPETP